MGVALPSGRWMLSMRSLFGSSSATTRATPGPPMGRISAASPPGASRPTSSRWLCSGHMWMLMRGPSRLGDLLGHRWLGASRCYRACFATPMRRATSKGTRRCTCADPGSAQISGWLRHTYPDCTHHSKARQSGCADEASSGSSHPDRTRSGDIWALGFRAGWLAVLSCSM